MGSAFHQSFPRYSWTLTPTVTTTIRLWKPLYLPKVTVSKWKWDCEFSDLINYSTKLKPLNIEAICYGHGTSERHVYWL